jgi:hypothetical protein
MRMMVSAKDWISEVKNKTASMGRGERNRRNQPTQQKQKVVKKREPLKRIKDKADQLNKEVKKIMDKEGNAEGG